MGGTPSWDLFIVLFFIALVAYGFLMQRDKAVVTMISIYVAIVVTAVLAGPVGQFFAGDKTIANQIYIKANANSFTIQTAIFLIIIVLVSAKSGIEGHGSKSSVMELFGFSLLNAALIITTILLYMDPAKREAVIHTSKIANLLIHYQTWWLVLPVVFLVFTGWGKSDH